MRRQEERRTSVHAYIEVCGKQKGGERIKEDIY